MAAVYDAEAGYASAFDEGSAYDLAAGHDPTAGYAPVPAHDVPPVARFPISRQGYDCDTVDAHVADLERELSELEQRLAQAEAQVPSRSEVAIEIERIGEQTSAILVAAHDEAQQTVRAAQSQAETVISDATSYAAALTEEAEIKVRRLETEAASLSDRRERLIDEMRTTARALTSLADEAATGSAPAAG
jgi:cell division septum initiation protein DivIVA